MDATIQCEHQGPHRLSDDRRCGKIRGTKQYTVIIETYLRVLPARPRDGRGDQGLPAYPDDAGVDVN